MHYRPITPETYEDFYRLRCRAFNIPFDPKALENPRCQGVRGFFEGDHLLAALNILHYDSYFAGRRLPTGGIGDVISQPETRRQGHVRHLFQHAMEEMAYRGMVLSFLYPFSHRYYRQFGYESCITQQRIRVELSALAQRGAPGYCLPYAAQDIDAIAAIYDNFSHKHDLMAYRSRDSWALQLEKDPEAANEYTYLWYDDKEAARAYLQISFDPQDREAFLVRNLAWTTMESLRGLLDFISRWEAGRHYVVLDLPMDLPIEFLLPEPSRATIEKKIVGMGRVVRAYEALAALKAPQGAGDLTLGITDDFFPENTGNYRVQWEAGALTAQPTQGAAQVKLGIRALMPLVAGHGDPRAMTLRPDLEVLDNEEAFLQLFPQKSPWLRDRF